MRLKESFPKHLRLVLSLSLLGSVAIPALPAPKGLEIRVSPRRPAAGDFVRIEVRIPAANRDGAEPKAVMLVPHQGCLPLNLTAVSSAPGSFRAEWKAAPNAPEGLYAVQAWTGDEEKPSALGKGSFLFGKIVADYPILSAVDRANPAGDIRAYLEEFRTIGGNFLILHVLMDSTKAYYPSAIAKTEVKPGASNDLVENFLRLSDEIGFPCLLSVSWDITHPSSYADYPAEIKAVAADLFGLYGHHPSLAGFYSYQEGSGTYLVPYLREFCAHVKSLNSGLLTGCAPYVDDPLLSGYLGALDDLDVIIYQGMVMASYRPDNVKKYPLRRVRDFCGVGVGGKWLQDKMAITHMELFGYGENRISDKHNTTSGANIYQQILSAAAAAGSDGISLFTYHFNIHQFAGKFPEIARSRAAVEDGLRVFNLIWDKISRTPNRLAVYYPYSDWVIERWTSSYLPALDAFRKLGIPIDFLPFEPAADESLYPFYPYHQNEEVLTRLAAAGTVLVLPDVSGFHATDSDFIKSFVAGGGALVAFGPQIPGGTTYNRDELFGGVQIRESPHSLVVMRDTPGPRTKNDLRYPLDGRAYPSWRPTTAKTIAAFEDGSAVVWINRYGKGSVAAFAVDAATAAERIPDIVRDVLDEALQRNGASRQVDILGLNENVDVAIANFPGGFRAAVINHNPSPLEVTFRPLRKVETGGIWFDLATQKPLTVLENKAGLVRTIPARNFLGLEFREK
jgi:hypothetical protein